MIRPTTSAAHLGARRPPAEAGAVPVVADRARPRPARRGDRRRAAPPPPRPADRLARPAPGHQGARGRGERIHPASAWLANESAHVEDEAAEHDLHAFQAIRRMDEILVNNFMVFNDVVNDEHYDLVIGDEAWDVDYFLHENPELKRFAFAWMTDFVGWLPMPDGGDHEAALTADYNAEMIEQRARFRRLRDRSIFVGDPDDIVPDSFGPTCRRSASGPRRTSSSPATSPASTRRVRRSRGPARRARLPARRTGVHRDRRRIRRRRRPPAPGRRRRARRPPPGRRPALRRRQPGRGSTRGAAPAPGRVVPPLRPRTSTATSPRATSPSCRAG